VWYLGVVVVCGAIGSLIVTAKGFEWWIGLLLGVFGPFGVVIAIVIKRGHPAPALPPPPPGARWAPDPTRRHEMRLWDGQRWTGDVSDHGAAGSDPLH
jgi:cell division protein FtsW (lipid II flippase)